MRDRDGSGSGTAGNAHQHEASLFGLILLGELLTDLDDAIFGLFGQLREHVGLDRFFGDHQDRFDGAARLVVGHGCLSVIDVDRREISAAPIADPLDGDVAEHRALFELDETLLEHLQDGEESHDDLEAIDEP